MARETLPCAPFIESLFRARRFDTNPCLTLTTIIGSGETVCQTALLADRPSTPANHHAAVELSAEVDEIDGLTSVLIGWAAIAGLSAPSCGMMTAPMASMPSDEGRLPLWSPAWAGCGFRTDLAWPSYASGSDVRTKHVKAQLRHCARLRKQARTIPCLRCRVASP